MKPEDANPAGLSTHNPMLDARYRATVRAISDRYRKLKGRPRVPDFEKVWETEPRPLELAVSGDADADLRKREAAMEFAIDNTRLSGGEVSEETRARMRAWVRGEIDDERLMSPLAYSSAQPKRTLRYVVERDGDLWRVFAEDGQGRREPWSHKDVAEACRGIPVHELGDRRGGRNRASLRKRATGETIDEDSATDAFDAAAVAAARKLGMSDADIEALFGKARGWVGNLMDGQSAGDEGANT